MVCSKKKGDGEEMKGWRSRRGKRGKRDRDRWGKNRKSRKAREGDAFVSRLARTAKRDVGKLRHERRKNAQPCAGPTRATVRI